MMDRLQAWFTPVAAYFLPHHFAFFFASKCLIGYCLNEVTLTEAVDCCVLASSAAGEGLSKPAAQQDAHLQCTPALALWFFGCFQNLWFLKLINCSRHEIVSSTKVALIWFSFFPLSSCLSDFILFTLRATEFLFWCIHGAIKLEYGESRPSDCWWRITFISIKECLL